MKHEDIERAGREFRKYDRQRLEQAPWLIRAIIHNRFLRFENALVAKERADDLLAFLTAEIKCYRQPTPDSTTVVETTTSGIMSDFRLEHFRSSAHQNSKEENFMTLFRNLEYEAWSAGRMAAHVYDFFIEEEDQRILVEQWDAYTRLSHVRAIKSFHEVYEFGFMVEMSLDSFQAACKAVGFMNAERAKSEEQNIIKSYRYCEMLGSLTTSELETTKQWIFNKE